MAAVLPSQVFRRQLNFKKLAAFYTSKSQIILSLSCQIIRYSDSLAFSNEFKVVGETINPKFDKDMAI